MLTRRTFLSTAALSSLGLPRMLRASVLPGSIFGGEEPMIVCAVGSLKRTSPAERLMVSASDNDNEREKIVAQVARENPGLLLLLGDQVGDSGDPSEWKYFDHLTQPLRDAKIPTLAVRGEKEYSIVNRELSDQESHKRWPETRECPHFRTIGSIAYIGIDTSFDVLTEAQAAGQQRRYVETLQKLDGDPAIRGVIVMAHHAPYTNSALGPSRDVATGYAEPFLAATKTRIFLCGHVRSYERFMFDDGRKQFVNSGGGGGPRRSVDVSESRSFKNDFRTKLGEVRPFNYLKLTIADGIILGEGMMLQKRGFVVGDRFRLTLA